MFSTQEDYSEVFCECGQLNTCSSSRNDGDGDGTAQGKEDLRSESENMYSRRSISSPFLIMKQNASQQMVHQKQQDSEPHAWAIQLINVPYAELASPNSLETQTLAAGVC